MLALSYDEILFVDRKTRIHVSQSSTSISDENSSQSSEDAVNSKDLHTTIP